MGEKTIRGDALPMNGFIRWKRKEFLRALDLN